jgi:predicted amidohydrolase
MFVCSVNNASPPQELKSYLVSPKGEIVLQVKRQKENTMTAEIDLSHAIADLSKREDY